MKVLIDTETYVYQTREPDPEDSWDMGDSAGYVSNVIARDPGTRGVSSYRGSDSIVIELPVKIGDTIYAVVADYESGSTFGRDGGHASVLDAFMTIEEAEALIKVAKEPSAGYAFTYNGVEYYRSWEGYFESLNSLDIWSLTVGGPGHKIS
jgi:hypothetical protein